MKNIYWLHGDYNRIQKKLKSKFKELEISSDSIIEFNKKDVEIINIIDEIKICSLFNDQKAVVIKNVDKELSDKIIEVLPIPKANFVFLISETIDKRLKLYKVLNKSNNVIGFDKFDYGDNKSQEKIVQYCNAYVKKYGKKIKKDAIYLLLDKVGGIQYKDSGKTNISVNFKKIDSELDKLLIFDEDIIDKEIVDDLIESSGERNIFDINNAIFDKNTQKAIRVFYQVIKNSNDNKANIFYNGLLFNLTNTYKALLYMKIISMQKRCNKKELVNNAFNILHYSISKNGEVRFSYPQLYAISNLLNKVSINRLYNGIVNLNLAYDKIRSNINYKKEVIEILIIGLSEDILIWN